MIDSPIDEIKSKLDIVEVVQGYMRLTKAGRNYRANCPFHSEKTPSFFVSPERQMWHCFGCGKGSSIFDFVMEMEGVEFGDALRILARRAGVELKKIDPKFKTKKTRLYEICELATRFFARQLEASQAGHQVQKYLKDRGFKPKILSEWRIGYAPEQWRACSEFLQGRGYREEEIINVGLAIKSQRQNKPSYDRFRHRIIFPIADLNGLIVGFSGRIFGSGEPKYINTPNTLLYDKSLVLYGLDKAKLAIRKEKICVLAEGQMDVLAAHQAGFSNVIAISGTALTPHHLKIIKRYTENLSFAFDMDVAGESATKRGLDLAIASGLNTQIISLPQDQDPADYLKANPAGWSELVAKSQSMLEFYFTTAFSRFDAAVVDGKKSIAKILLPVIRQIPNRIEQAYWLAELSARLKTEEKVLIEEMQKIPLSRDIDQEEGDLEKDICLEPTGQNQVLAQYVLGLLLTYPDQIEEVRSYPSSLFTHPELEEIFKELKKIETDKFDLKNFQRKLPAHLVDQVEGLLFRIETLEKENFDPSQEVDFCFAKLKKEHLQGKLNKLNLAIKDAENKKDKTSLKDLTVEFHKLSQQLSIV